MQQRLDFGLDKVAMAEAEAPPSERGPSATSPLPLRYPSCCLSAASELPLCYLSPQRRGPKEEGSWQCAWLTARSRHGLEAE